MDIHSRQTQLLIVVLLLVVSASAVLLVTDKQTTDSTPSLSITSYHSTLTVTDTTVTQSTNGSMTTYAVTATLKSTTDTPEKTIHTILQCYETIPSKSLLTTETQNTIIEANETAQQTISCTIPTNTTPTLSITYG
jgi:hypothetical protein